MANNQQYIKDQFEKVSTVYEEYQPKLKIIKPNGKQTNWLDITEKDLRKIKELMLQSQSNND